jgi:hypothetical protein
MIRVTLLALFCALSSAAAWGQFRSIPVEAKRGEIRSLGHMEVEINGKALHLAPGAQIRDAGNRIVLPTAVPAGAKVKYLLDPQNLVNRVWILSPQEAAQPDPRQ